MDVMFASRLKTANQGRSRFLNSRRMRVFKLMIAATHSPWSFALLCALQEWRHWTPYLFSVHVLHLVVAGDQQPAVLVAEPDHFRIRNIPQWLASLITEPFGEPLNCESSCRQTLGYGRSRKALVQK